MEHQDAARVQGVVTGASGPGLRTGQNLRVRYRALCLECVPVKYRTTGTGSGGGALDAVEARVILRAGCLNSRYRLSHRQYCRD